MRIRATFKKIQRSPVPSRDFHKFEAETVVDSVIKWRFDEEEWPEEEDLEEAVARYFGWIMIEDQLRRAAKNAFEAGYLTTIGEEDDEIILPSDHNIFKIR